MLLTQCTRVTTICAALHRQLTWRGSQRICISSANRQKVRQVCVLISTRLGIESNYPAMPITSEAMTEPMHSVKDDPV